MESSDGLGNWQSLVSRPATTFDDLYLINGGTSGEPFSTYSQCMLLSTRPEKIQKRFSYIKKVLIAESITSDW